MELSVQIMSKAATIESILRFQTDKTSIYWRDPLFKMYPFLDKKKGLKASWKNRKKYLKTTLNNYYDQTAAALVSKAKVFNNCWSVHQENIIKIFTDVFDIDCKVLFNNMSAEISLNPICPRDLNNYHFSVFYKNDEKRFLETALHEIIHFVWFYLWKSYFNDDCKEYEAPHLKWILSEMVVDTFVRNTKIGQLFSPDGRNNAAYKYFYTMKVNDTLILETLSRIYQKSQNLRQFMEQVYKYCQDHEQALREQML